MGRADGRIVGSQKIVDAGPAADRWNLVIMGDGYQAGAGMLQFHADADALAATLLATPPYPSLTAAINIFRIDVESVGTGVKEPPACGGNGTRFRTYFEASLCGDQIVKRYLTVKKALALAAADLHVPEWDQIIVIANSPLYGGAAMGGVATCTKYQGTWSIAMHELGHNLGLADEYEENAGSYPAAWFDSEPNVSKQTGFLKWASQIAPGTPIPTQVYPNCGRPGPASAGIAGIGAFEGGKRFTCGVFRPSEKCKMRSLADDFCPVCQAHIRANLSQFLPQT